MDFEIDISQINLSGDPDGISLSEILSVNRNEKSRLREIPDYPKKYFYSIEAGYSNKKRILLVASRILDDKRQIVQVKVAEESEIEQYYCNG